MSEGLLRKAEIAQLKQKKEIINIECLSLATDIRMLLNPKDIKDLSTMETDRALVLLNSLNDKVNEMKDIQKNINYKESL